MTRVRQANAEILIATRRLEFDAFGQMLLSELEYACQRGLRVCCLLDVAGCSGFIADHPALFLALETRFRVRDAVAVAGAASLLVFDRGQALTGDFLLCADAFTEKDVFVSVTGTAAAELALTFDTAWLGARDPLQPAS